MGVCQAGTVHIVSHTDISGDGVRFINEWPQSFIDDTQELIATIIGITNDFIPDIPIFTLIDVGEANDFLYFCKQINAKCRNEYKKDVVNGADGLCLDGISTATRAEP